MVRKHPSIEPMKSKTYVPQDFFTTPLIQNYIVVSILLTVLKLLDAIQDLIIPYIRSADEDAATKHTGHGLAIPGGGPRTTLVEHHPPQKLEPLLDLKIPQENGGKDGLLQVVQKVLQYSVNTWDQGFMDKLYGSTNAVSHSNFDYANTCHIN